MDERMDPSVAKDMLHGRSDALNSAFHLTYSMVLNVTRIEGANLEGMMTSSFAQFQNDRNLPKLEAAAAALAKERDAVEVEDSEAVAEYVNMRDTLAVLRSERRDILNLPVHCVPFLNSGRIIRVCTADPKAVSAAAASAGEDGGAAAMASAEVNAEWGAIVDFKRDGSEYTVDVLVMTVEAAADKRQSRVGRQSRFHIRPIVTPSATAENGKEAATDAHLVATAEPRVLSLPLSQIDAMTKVRVYFAKNLVPIEGRQRGQKSIAEVIKRFPDGIPLLDPEEDMKIDSSQFRKLVRRIEALEGMLEKHPLASSPKLPVQLAAFSRRRELALRCKIAKREVKAASGMILRDELRYRQRVLRRLNHLSEEGVVMTKGRVACALTSADELVTTELIFNGTFKELDAEMCVALISALCWREKGKDPKELKLSEESKEVHDRLCDAVRMVGKQVSECKLNIDVNEYVESFRADLMDLVRVHFETVACPALFLSVFRCPNRPLASHFLSHSRDYSRGGADLICERCRSCHRPCALSREWAKGAPFIEIMNLAQTQKLELFEGSVVRAIRRMEEVMRQLVTACQVIGETELEAKFEECRTLIKRGIVFVDSLFL